MQHLKFVFILTLSFAALLFSCSKKSSTPAPTSLQITFTDAGGSLVPGTSVTLYPSEAAYLAGTNAIETGTTDSKGMISFTNLSSNQYYWLAQDGCLNNVNGIVTTLNPLTANANNEVTSVLTSTGVLKFVNTSSNPYHVYANGTLLFDVAGGQTQYSYWVPIGNYTIRVVQVSGYAVTPTDESFTGTVTCGVTLTTTFP